MSRTETPAAKLARWQGWADEALGEARAAAIRGDRAEASRLHGVAAVYARMAAGTERDYEADPLLPPEGPLIAMDRMAPAVIIPAEDFARLANLLEAARYRFAYTMPWNPHWYTLRKTWPSHADFDWAQEAILRYGYRAKFGRRWYGQIDVGDFFYWLCGYPVEVEILINRKPLPTEGPPMPKELKPWYRRQLAERDAKASATRIEPVGRLLVRADADEGGEERSLRTIRQLRRERGLTQQALADRAGLALLSVANYERGDQEPRASALRRIASALGVSMDAIVLVDAHATGGDEAPPVAPEARSWTAVEEVAA